MARAVSLVVSLVVTTASASCGSPTKPVESTPTTITPPPSIPAVAAAPKDPPFELTAFELELIRNSLGALTTDAPPDPTNKFATSPAAAALGQRFFFDTRFSSNGAVSCATCHDPKTGFQDARANVSLGIKHGTRHTPTCLNSAFGSGDGTIWQFWDGRSDSLWAQALGPPENDLEMGGSRTAIAYAVYDHYRAPFEAVFGPMPALRDATGKAKFPERTRPGDAAWKKIPKADQLAFNRIFANWGKAIAAYEHKLVSRNARWDTYWNDIAGGASDSNALSYQEKQGLRVFLGKAGCVACHDGPTFTDWQFHNVGVAQNGPNLPAEDTGRAGGIETAKTDEFGCASAFSDHPDKSQCEAAGLAHERAMTGAFKTPGLRDLSKTAPYMHTGTFKTLEEVIDLYDRGGDGKGFVGPLDQKIGKLNLTPADKAALLAFLRTLDGEPLAPELLAAPNP